MAARPRSAAFQPHIIGGSNGAQGDWGFMAFVLHFDSAGNPDFSCSGTLVSANVVLTAGHCAVDESTGDVLDPSGYSVVTGAVDWTDTTNREVGTVSRVIVYPAFDPSVPQHDAALLVLSSPVSDPTIPLWATGGLSAGTGALIAGWGNIYPGQSSQQTVLQWASTTVQSVRYCGQEAPFERFAYDSYSDLCTINPPNFNTGTCEGDSGGPLLADDASDNLIEIGLTSVGAGDCNTAYPDYFTDIQPIEPWIVSEVDAFAPSGSGPPTAASAPSQMTIAAARSYVRQVVAHVFRHEVRHALRISSCGSAATKSHIRCSFTFWSGPNDYWGFVTVYYYTASNGTTYWASHYSTYWVNDRCYNHTNHPQTCRLHRRRGSW